MYLHIRIWFITVYFSLARCNSQGIEDGSSEKNSRFLKLSVLSAKISLNYKNKNGIFNNRLINSRGLVQRWRNIWVHSERGWGAETSRDSGTCDFDVRCKVTN